MGDGGLLYQTLQNGLAGWEQTTQMQLFLFSAAVVAEISFEYPALKANWNWLFYNTFDWGKQTHEFWIEMTVERL